MRLAGEPFGRRRDGHRPAEEIPLREAAAGGAQEIALAGGFHAFRHYLDAEFMREPDGGAHDSGAIGTGRHVFYEALVDFETRRREMTG